jgi:hypothetical protein
MLLSHCGGFAIMGTFADFQLVIIVPVPFNLLFKQELDRYSRDRNSFHYNHKKPLIVGTSGVLIETLIHIIY